jgi:hypothetical protein
VFVQQRVWLPLFCPLSASRPRLSGVGFFLSRPIVGYAAACRRFISALRRGRCALGRCRLDKVERQRYMGICGWAFLS